MPITTAIPLRCFTQSEFGDVAYQVVGHAFQVHEQLGRIFHESIYRSTLKHLIGTRAVEEVGIRLSHQGFEKDLYMDLVVYCGCPFELKVVRELTDNHRSQLIQYLMLTDLSHGKLINFGNERVEHEFVNCLETTEHRRAFEVDKRDWPTTNANARQFENLVIDLLRDWGSGLDRALYHEAIVALLGGTESVCSFVDTTWERTVTGRQPVSLIDASTAFVITCKRREIDQYEGHLKRFLSNTGLESIYWANVVSGCVSFRAIKRGS